MAKNNKSSRSETFKGFDALKNFNFGNNDKKSADSSKTQNFNQQQNSPRGYNRNSDNRNNNRRNNSFHGTPQTAARATATAANELIATAPYNFVSLPQKVLASEIDSVENFENHIQTLGKISGEIVLEIENLTPLFIGGNAEKSFAPAGKFIIPGSTLRGMFKNIFKIVTCGAFRGSTNSQQKGEDFNDEHIYYRCLMGVGKYFWTKDLNKAYNARMVGTIRGKDGKIKPAKNARPGFLIQTKDNKSFIAPSIYEHDRKDDFIMIKEFQDDFFNIGFRDSRVYWAQVDGEYRAHILTGNQWADTQKKPDNHKHLLTRKQYEEYRASLKGLTAEEIAKKNEELKYGKQIIRFVKLSYVDWSKRIELPDDVLKSYEHDRNRRGVNLFTDNGILTREQLERLCGDSLPADVQTLIPCHFLYEGGQVTAFGHGQCFRIPYKNSIGDIVPANLQSEKTIDFADAVFGRKEFWASRVAFEDAVPISPVKIFAKAAAHPLMQPNPTSYQLYLKQDGETLTHWDKNKPQLRGYKLYWHNGNWDWRANPNERGDLTKELTPFAAGNKFKSKIRFQNLSEVELGALMMIFDLNGAENPAYKIGMGKSFGFGSIKVTPKLFIENNDAYTAEIFDSDGFKSTYSASNAEDYIKVFKEYLNAKIGLTAWQEVMNELNKILDWENKPAPEKIKSMSGDVQQGNVDERFKQRAPLPTIFEVVK